MSAYVAAGSLVAGIAAGALLGRRLVRARAQRAEALRRSTERQAFHAHLLAQVTDAIVVTDPDGLVTTWNPAAETLFGHAADAAIGRPLRDLVVQRAAANRQGDLQSGLAHAGEWKGDAEIVRPSGEIVFIEASVRALLDADGNRRGQLIIGHDIDARRRTEMEARQRARQQAAIASLGQRALAGIDLGLLLEQAAHLVAEAVEVRAAGVFRHDEDRRLRLVTGVGWGLAPDSLVFDAGMPGYPGTALASESPVTADAAAVPLLAAERFATTAAVAIPGAPRPFGLLLVADRRRRTFSRDDLHFLQAVANVIGATRERLTIEGELRASIALQRATLESVGEGIVVTDEARRVTACNQRFLEMWRIPPHVRASNRFDDWVGHAAAQFANPAEARGRFVDGEAGHTVLMELADGRVYERHSQPQRVDGRTVGRVWCFRDLTERVRAEDERRRFEAQMQHVQKLESLGVLAGGIAHDFNNLLVSILGHAGLALAELPPGAAATERITQISIAAQRAAELTGQMLAYAGKSPLVVQPADLSAIVEEMANLLRAAVSKNVRLTLDIDPDLPPFEGDPGQIRQVIMNLITNASDAIGPEPGSITVSTGSMLASSEYLRDACLGSDLRPGAFVFAEVRDDGCGMGEATLARIFDPFFTTKVTGRGLGLAAALGIVRSHRGAIRITSAPGAGTTFRVLFPALPAARTPRPAAPAAASQAALPPAMNARVLVVDDEEPVRAIAGESLMRAGFEVATADCGEAALELLRGSAFDAVLLDLSMPGMPGADVFRTMKALRPDLPIVLTSGYSRQQAATHFDGHDIGPFIQKPFLPSALVRALRAAVSSRGVEPVSP